MSQPLLFPLLKVGRTLPQALGLALFSLIGALGMIPLGLISVIWKIHRLVYLVGSFHSHCMACLLPSVLDSTTCMSSSILRGHWFSLELRESRGDGGALTAAPLQC